MKPKKLLQQRLKMLRQELKDWDNPTFAKDKIIAPKEILGIAINGVQMKTYCKKIRAQIAEYKTALSVLESREKIIYDFLIWECKKFDSLEASTRGNTYRIKRYFKAISKL